MRCARAYIQGLELEHEKGLYVLGPGTTSDPAQMSLYVTPAQYRGKAGLYLQSNYKPLGGPFPIKILLNDDLNPNQILTWFPVPGKPTSFNSTGVTVYLEPSFAANPVYGKYRDQFPGKVVVLKEGWADQRSFQDFREADIHLWKGYELSGQGLKAQAIQEFNLAIGLKPDFPEALNGRGNVYRAQKKYSLAIADFNKAIELAPRDDMGYCNRAVLNCFMGRFAYSVADDNQAIQLNPLRPDAYFNRGLAYHFLGRYANAVSDFKKVLKLKPNHPFAGKFLAEDQKKVTP